MSELKSKSGASGPLQSPAQRHQSSIAVPCPIRFTRAICGDLGQAERREWWIANGLGGYASGTIAGSLARRYHGLLIAPVASPLGRRLILAKADATLIKDSRSWPLFTNRWKSGDIAPTGHVRIGSFHLDYSLPVWTYEIGDRHVEARIWMEPGAHTTPRGSCGRGPIRRITDCPCGSPCWPTTATTMGRLQSVALSPGFGSMARLS
jgi:hypothetical protein